MAAGKVMRRFIKGLVARMLPEIREIPLGTAILNRIFQRVFGVNGDVEWSVHYTSRCTGRVDIGRNVWISFAVSGNCYIQGINGIEIGDDTIFAPGVKIISANHDADDFSVHKAAPPVRIGRRCWIGTNAVVLPGVEIGDNMVVGAGSVVTQSFGANLVVAGNPARVIRHKTTGLYYEPIN